MSEDEEDHVGCNGEGCPNKCASGVDGGHVEEAVGGCGGVGQDVGGVVHGYIAQVEKNYNGKSHNRIHEQDSVPKFLNVVQLFPAPGPCSSQPQGHKTASKFQQIRCTICLTSPDNQKEKGPHLKVVCLPDSYVVT